MKGIVKFFNNRLSWGFITGDDEKDYFVYYTGISSKDSFKSLKNNTRVVFDTKETPDHGVQAVNVRTMQRRKRKSKKRKK